KHPIYELKDIKITKRKVLLILSSPEIFKSFLITIASSQVPGDQMEGLQTTTIMDAVYDCITDALIIYNSSLPLSDSPITSSLYSTTTNEGIKSNDYQIESVPLAALVLMIINDQTMSSPNSSQYMNKEIVHNSELAQYGSRLPMLTNQKKWKQSQIK
ncbi:43596_t:CDS:2, partial [Gigaspora margarita]